MFDVAASELRQRLTNRRGELTEKIKDLEGQKSLIAADIVNLRSKAELTDKLLQLDDDSLEAMLESMLDALGETAA